MNTSPDVPEQELHLYTRILSGKARLTQYWVHTLNTEVVSVAGTVMGRKWKAWSEAASSQQPPDSLSPQTLLMLSIALLPFTFCTCHTSPEVYQECAQRQSATHLPWAHWKGNWHLERHLISSWHSLVPRGSPNLTAPKNKWHQRFKKGAEIKLTKKTLTTREIKNTWYCSNTVWIASHVNRNPP